MTSLIIVLVSIVAYFAAGSLSVRALTPAIARNNIIDATIRYDQCTKKMHETYPDDLPDRYENCIKSYHHYTIPPHVDRNKVLRLSVAVQFLWFVLLPAFAWSYSVNKQIDKHDPTKIEADYKKVLERNKELEDLLGIEK